MSSGGSNTDAFILTSRLYDKFLDEKKPKINHSKDVFGKPNVIIKGKDLSLMNEQILAELIEKQERDNLPPQLEYYLAKIRKDDEINEYNRAQISEHIAAAFNSSRRSKFGEGANLKNDLKIIEKIDSSDHKDSYFNQI
jgi:hypothetical protein